MWCLYRYCSRLIISMWVMWSISNQPLWLPRTFSLIPNVGWVTMAAQVNCSNPPSKPRAPVCWCHIEPKDFRPAVDKASHWATAAPCGCTSGIPAYISGATGFFPEISQLSRLSLEILIGFQSTGNSVKPWFSNFFTRLLAVFLGPLCCNILKFG